MRSLRIQGLVRLADRARRELTSPVSTARRNQLRGLVTDALQQVDRILSDHRTTIDGLPSPSRRAYGFLKGLDFDAVAISAGNAGAGAGNLGLVGLKSFLNKTLHYLACADTPERFDFLHCGIVSFSRNVERFLAHNDIRVGSLTPTARSSRGWLAFFADRGNFDNYINAARLARPIFDDAARRSGQFHPPAFIHFRPIKKLYRLYGYRQCMRVDLPTPMIALTREDFLALADAAFYGGSRRHVMELMTSEACQAIQAELEALGGIVEQAAGMHHDLSAAFERVRHRYFDVTSGRPRLTWGRTFTGRKFGHYDCIRDTLMVSASLDRKDVPEFVVDFIVYHELLHKKLGRDWRNGRACDHTPQFRAEEQKFEKYAEAEAALNRLAAAL